ncbi:PTS system mannose/fructose/N-acetylgalactosamine-transporter subunit IIB [Clostridium beijerinckii]|uniref:PTS system mannose-specific IIB component n=1 Tax=Clostridium beijerinckii TaxID=1520 RepID=A0AAX0AV93_CLOBE|nr:PTS sugar transporter subunit IIB [Clostridium beijerinckii]MBA8933876.1 PTS system mannose-specific IIB component [Clostridium beijerinckii]NOW05188.1 PTS system mannose-specific IIB component [Clostridium beijerinckii]NRT36212.1 PTS system mannose-specific IIB component [Clostridium beijerinckii]NRT44361.1 PTS system mannose-specific IIB component [Clostridium beijerinckii]NRT86373.1 PTS system mannose-specific IIB component [Clostridium beijerinckii]
MIEMIRLDDRLVHGQVAVIWSKRLGVDRIIVASDEAANDELQSSALKMAAPPSAKVFVLEIEKAATIINDVRSKDKKILVVTDSPDKIYRLVSLIDEKPAINVANYGRIAGTSDKSKVTETVYTSKNENELFKKLIDKKYEVFYQPLPEDKKILLSDLIQGGE